MQNPLEKTWKTYASTWKTTSESERQQLFDQALDPACKYLDPQSDLAGVAALSASISGFQEQFPGAEFVTTQFWSHGRKCLARWEMRGGSGALLGEGASFGEFNEAGKLAAITGFFDVPAE